MKQRYELSGGLCRTRWFRMLKEPVEIVEAQSWGKGGRGNTRSSEKGLK